MGRLFTVKQVVKEYPAFTESGLRWLLFNKETNGIESAVIKLGGRVYIDGDEFDSYLERHRCGSSAGMGG